MFSFRNVQDETFYLPVNLMILSEFGLRESGSEVTGRLIKRYYMHVFRTEYSAASDACFCFDYVLM